MEKIPWTFVNIRESDGKYLLDYMDEDGKLYWVDILNESMPQMVSFNKRELEEALEKLSAETDPIKRREIEWNTKLLKMCIRLPEMYAAYCGGKDVGEFFERGGANPPVATIPAASPRFVPKHKTIKEDIDFLFDKMRLVFSNALMKEAIALYAALTGEKPENISQNYYYDTKKTKKKTMKI